MPAMIELRLALVSLGYSLRLAPGGEGLQAIERFGIETADTFRLQSCVSPVWIRCSLS